jgi:LysM repeat protein
LRLQLLQMAVLSGSRSGDTVSTIARRNRVNEADIIRLNSIDGRGRIFAGQQLRLPATAEAQVIIGFIP